MPELQDYRRLFEESPTPMYVFDSSDYSFLTVNESALQQYGYSREDFLQLHATDIRPEEEWAAFYRANESIPFEYHDAGVFIHKNKSGKVFFVQAFTHRTIFMGREAVLVLALNIDEKIKAQKALAEKTQDTEIILESITDAFYAVDSEWRFIYVNNEYERVHKLRREDLIGKNVWEIFPSSKELRFYREYEQVRRQKVSAHFEEFNPANGMWVRVNDYPTREGGVAVYFVDITEKKKIEQQLIRDEQNLRAIINNTKDIIWSVDKNFRIISANNAFWKRIALITGKATKQVNEADYDPELFAAWRQYFERAIAGETYTMTWEDTSGDIAVYEEISFNPMHDREGNVWGISCFSRDVTEQKVYLQKIERQNARLREITKVQSHQVRNHVANMLGLCALLNVSKIEDNQTAGLINGLQKSAMKLDEVIREICRFSQEGLEAI